MRLLKAQIGERLYTYYDDRVESLRAGTQTRIPYETIGRVLAYHDNFYLVIGTEEIPSMVHPKDKFTVGNADDFETFIQEKTGKPVEYIKY